MADELPEKLAVQYGPEVVTLDVSYNMLPVLDHLQHFVKVTSIVADNNDVGDTMVLPPLPTLHTLSLNNNKIEDLDRLLEILKQSCPNLQYLSLLKNPACPNDLLGGDDDDYNRYRRGAVHLCITAGSLRVLFRLNGLKFLDSRPVSAAERKEAMRVGPYLKVARPSSETLEQARKLTPNEEGSQIEYGALPSDLTPEGDHSGTFGVSRYVYYGRHSEGNRFIRNNDL